MNHLANVATFAGFGLTIWLLFIRKPMMNKPMIWLCVGVLCVSLSYRFNVTWACVGLVLISLIRFRQIEPQPRKVQKNAS